MKRLLVVDDEAVVLDVLRRILQLLKYEVATGTTVAEGLAQLAEGDFDALLTDLSLPDGSGLDVARAAKAAHPDRPVVVITGWSDAGSQSEVEGIVDAVMTKPFGVDSVRKVLESVGVAES